MLDSCWSRDHAGERGESEGRAWVGPTEYGLNVSRALYASNASRCALMNHNITGVVTDGDGSWCSAEVCGAAVTRPHEPTPQQDPTRRRSLRFLQSTVHSAWAGFPEGRPRTS